MISEFFIEASLEMHNICTVIPRSIPSVKLLYAATGLPVGSVGMLIPPPQAPELALLGLTPNRRGSKLLLTSKMCAEKLCEAQKHHSHFYTALCQFY